MPGKLEKYSNIKKLANVVEAGFISENPLKIAGKWDEGLFIKKQPLTLELGCGRGEYTVSLAKTYPHRNFIGVDIKGARLWHGASHAIENGLTNAIFARMNIDHLDIFFPEPAVSEIWITFPEPHERQSGKNSQRRLTSEKYLNKYRKILLPNGIINLKTDSDFLYEYTIETAEKFGCRILRSTSDLYSSPEKDDPVNVQTTFEKKYLSEKKTIKYIRFSFQN